MKIAYVITRSDVLGGASVHLLDLAEGVQELGHEVTIFVGGNGLVVDRARERGLDCQPLEHLVREISPFRDLVGFFEVRRRLRAWAPDVVHVHSAKAGILGRLAARSLGIPAIYTAHGWPFTEGVSERSRRLYTTIERVMARFSQRIITVSDYDRSIALAASVGNPHLIVTVHNGIPEIPPELRKQPDGQDAVRLIMVARFEEPKNHGALFEALQALRDQNWHLELVGDGPNFEKMKSLALGLKLAEKVTFVGASDNVPESLSRSDVLLLVSRWEGLPLTILEAMRAGLPVIASDVGGVRETVADGETGYLVPRDDIRALRDKISKLLQSDGLREELGRSGRLRYEREFTFRLMLDRTIAVYHSVLGESK
jgi:glycosyltransferase involved in cell wall biosynthesis